MSYSPLWLVKTQAQQTLRSMDEQARAGQSSHSGCDRLRAAVVERAVMII
jgi:hypothetical protein